MAIYYRFHNKSKNKCNICSKKNDNDYICCLLCRINMGNRFSLCFSIGKYSVIHTSHIDHDDFSEEVGTIRAIALELDDEESEIPGLILDERFKV